MINLNPMPNCPAIIRSHTTTLRPVVKSPVYFRNSITTYHYQSILDTMEKPNVPTHEEYQYLDLIRNILANGEYRPDRHELTVMHFSICVFR